jgi:serine/threonine-protein kinase HipA
MEKLSVWMYGKLIGSLSQQRNIFSFTYTPEALTPIMGLPLLSVSMLSQPIPYKGKVPRAFFDGLLPEGESRRMIAHDFNIKEENIFGLLKVLGRDCAGALVIVPEGEVPDEEGVPEPITDSKVAELIRNLHFAPLGVDEKVRVSLAGMQGKLLLARIDDGWGLPVNGAPSTHIIKPPHSTFPNMVYNEAFCMRIAHHLGVLTAEVEIEKFEGLPALVVKRYDRVHDNTNQVIRLHQEDFCQAHALSGIHKYEEKGGPSLQNCAKILSDWSEEAAQLECLLDIVTLNVLVGNGDAHAKNFSLIHQDSMHRRLAPAYDVISTIWYEGVSTIPGMFVNGNKNIKNTTKDDLIQEAISWGMPHYNAIARVNQLLSKAEEAVIKAASEIEPPPELVEMLQTRARRIKA